MPKDDDINTLTLLNLVNHALPLTTEVYSSDGKKRSVIAHYRFCSEEVDRDTGGYIKHFEATLNVGGFISFSIKERSPNYSCYEPCSFVYIKNMRNTTQSQNPSYTHIGTALHESAFRVAAAYTQGRVLCDVAWASGYFHFKNGFRIRDIVGEYPFSTYSTMIVLLDEAKRNNAKITKNFGGRHYYLPQHCINQLAQKYNLSLIAPPTESAKETENLHLIEALMQEVESQSLVGKLLVFLCHNYGESSQEPLDDWMEYAENHPALFCFFDLSLAELLQHLPLTEETLAEFMAGACIFILSKHDSIHQKQACYGNKLLYPSHSFEELVALASCDTHSFFDSAVAIGTQALAGDIPFDIDAMTIFYKQLTHSHELLDLWKQYSPTKHPSGPFL